MIVTMTIITRESDHFARGRFPTDTTNAAPLYLLPAALPLYSSTNIPSSNYNVRKIKSSEYLGH